MIQKIRSFLLWAPILGCLSSQAVAGVVISLVPESATVMLPGAGQTTEFSVEARIAADTGTQSLRAYNLPIDLTPPDGTDAPVGWTVTGVSVINEIAGDPPFVFNLDPLEGDVYAEDGSLFGSGVVLSTAPISLFSFTVQLSDQATVGDYLASYVRGALISVIDADGEALPVAEIELRSAAIELTAVPEPTAVSFLLVGATMASLRRRRVHKA